MIIAVMLSVLVCRADGIADLFAPVFSGATHRVKSGEIKGQKLKGRFDGMGIIRYKNKDIYFGDISDGVPHGKGVYLCADGNRMEGTPDAKVYIGRFKAGQRVRGICLDDDSELLYDGAFTNDKPEASYPATGETDYCGYFDCLGDSDGEWLYIGEITQDVPNGRGIIVFNNGDALISDFHEGVRKGIGLYISSEGEWQTEKSRNGDVTVMSSSAYYARIDSERKRKTRECLSNALKQFGDVLVASAEFVSQVNDLKSGNASGNTVGFSGEDENDSSADSSAGNYEADYAKWERRAKKHYDSITNLGVSVTHKNGDKSGSAAQSMSGGSYVSMKKSFREAQKQMASIRRKAAKNGIDIPQSKWETATISY